VAMKLCSPLIDMAMRVAEKVRSWRAWGTSTTGCRSCREASGSLFGMMLVFKTSSLKPDALLCLLFSVHSCVWGASIYELAMHSNVVSLGLALSSSFYPLWCSPTSDLRVQAPLNCIVPLFKRFISIGRCSYAGFSGPMRIMPIYTEHHRLILDYLHLYFLQICFSVASVPSV
jgi:hypothetical protein